MLRSTSQGRFTHEAATPPAGTRLNTPSRHDVRTGAAGILRRRKGALAADCEAMARASVPRVLACFLEQPEIERAGLAGKMPVGREAGPMRQGMQEPEVQPWTATRWRRHWPTTPRMPHVAMEGRCAL
jgi:hypothetical protein